MSARIELTLGRQVAVDLNGQLDPTEELEHLKAAEEAVLAKDDERVVTETRLNDELAGEF